MHSERNAEYFWYWWSHSFLCKEKGMEALNAFLDAAVMFILGITILALSTIMSFTALDRPDDFSAPSAILKAAITSIGRGLLLLEMNTTVLLV